MTRRSASSITASRAVVSSVPVSNAASVVLPLPSTAAGGSASGSAPPVVVRSRSNSPPPPPGTDPKLFHVVRRIVSQNPTLLVNFSGATPNEGPKSPSGGGGARAVLDVLTHVHREYRRKNQAVLLGSVGDVLRVLKSQGGVKRRERPSPVAVGGGSTTSTSQNRGGDNRGGHQSPQKRGRPSNGEASSGTTGLSSPPSAKRKRPSELLELSPPTTITTEERLETQYDETAIRHDETRSKLLSAASSTYGAVTGGTTMLNAGLRDRYGAMQRERDRDARASREAAEAEAKAEAEAEAEAEAADTNDTNANAAVERGESSLPPTLPEGGGEDATSSCSPPPPPSRPETPASSPLPPPPSAAPSNKAGAAVPVGGGGDSTVAAGGSTTAKKRRKKKSLSRADSSSASTFGGGGGGNFGGGNSESDVATPLPRPSERYADLGGLTALLTQIREIVEYPLVHPEIFRHLGVDPPRGVLLRGPPGCGKTHLANAIAGELGGEGGGGGLGVSYYRISAPEIVSGMSGESESRIRALFSAAASTAPSIIFIDEIDAIAPKRGDGGSSGGGGRGMEKRMVAQLLTCLDGLAPQNTRGGAPVMVLGATNRPDAIDPALRRAGRFDREIVLTVPDEDGRVGILKVMTRTMRLAGDFDYGVLAKKTPGFVGADVRSLTKEAAVIAINRIFRTLLPAENGVAIAAEGNDEGGGEEEADEARAAVGDEVAADCRREGGAATSETAAAAAAAATSGAIATKESSPPPPPPPSGNTSTVRRALTPAQLDPLYVTMDDFLAAIPHVQPSSKREGFATVPDVSWDDIGALQTIREELTLSVLEPISHPEKFKALGLPLPAGVMLYGPPGCGKTLLAKAIANESGANFISVKGPELLDKYVGESERAVRLVFERARMSSPCIVFFDELDSLCPKRGSDSGSGGGGVSERVVNQLLTEMDGLDSRRSVFVIAATNRPELIDPAMMRPGRLDKLLYVPLPSKEDRVAIIKALASKIKIGPDVDLDLIARSPRAEGYSGADCAALLREAGLAVLRDDSLSRRGGTPVAVETTAGGGGDSDAVERGSLQIRAQHFEYAFDHVLPSVSKRDQARYDRIKNRMARARTRGTVAEENTTEATEVENSPSSPPAVADASSTLPATAK